MREKNHAGKKLGAVMLAAALAIGALAPAVSTTEAATKYSVKKVSYSKDYKLDDGTTYFTVKGKFPTIQGDSEAATKINAALKKEKNRLIKVWKNDAPEYKTEYAEITQEGKVEWTYGDEITCKVTSNDENYFSVMLSGYLFTGGAHGTPYRSCLTFDAKTGEKLTAAKVFGISKKKLNQKVQKLYLKKFDKQNPNDGFYPVTRQEFQDSMKSMDFNSSFYVKNGKAVFYADQGELGPYAAGFIQVSATIK